MRVLRLLCELLCGRLCWGLEMDDKYVDWLLHAFSRQVIHLNLLFESRHGRRGGVCSHAWRYPPFAIERGITPLLCTSQAPHGPGRVALPQVPRCFSMHCVTTKSAQGYVELTTVERKQLPTVTFRVGSSSRPSLLLF